MAGSEPPRVTATFGLGPDGADHVRVWWTRAEVRVGATRAETKPWFEEDAVRQFRVELRAVYETLQGTASFEDMEEVISLQVSADRRGHVTVKGVARSFEGESFARLEFDFALDQTHLKATLEELDGWLGP